MTDHFSLPVGIRDYTTEHVRRIEFISNTILDESELWGYKKILTPIFEKLDSCLLYTSPSPRDRG